MKNEPAASSTDMVAKKAADEADKDTEEEFEDEREGLLQELEEADGEEAKAVVREKLEAMFVRHSAHYWVHRYIPPGPDTDLEAEPHHISPGPDS
eukprot:15484859-Alexandrium_andersonii.AAC.1